VNIQHAGAFTEYIPLLLNSTDSLQLVSPGKAILQKRGDTISVLYDAAAKASLKETTLKAGKQRVMVLQIESSGKLAYSFNME
jgi:hypothetical protein